MAALQQRASAVDGDLGKSFGRSLRDVVRRRDLLSHVEDRPGAALPRWLTLPDERFPGSVRSRAAARADHNGVQDERLPCGPEAGPGWPSLDADLADTIAALRPAEGREWMPGQDATASQLAALVSWLNQAPARLADMQEAGQRLAGMLGMRSVTGTSAEAERLVGLALLGERTAQPEAAWLHPSSKVHWTSRPVFWQSWSSQSRSARRRSRRLFTRDALELDLAALDVRFRDTHKGLRRWSGQARADRKALKAVVTSGKVDQAVLARLSEAVAWQRAERR